MYLSHGILDSINQVYIHIIHDPSCSLRFHPKSDIYHLIASTGYDLIRASFRILTVE